MPTPSRRAFVTTVLLGLSVLGIAPAAAAAAPGQVTVPGHLVAVKRSHTPIGNGPGTFRPHAGGRQSLVAGAAAAPRSTWQVTYTGFTPAARAAFQAAVDIWAGIVASPMPIKVDATFADLGKDVLGFAGPDDFFSGQGIGDGSSLYPSALADALTGTEHGPAGAPDIDAMFSSTEPGIYYGTDSKPGANMIDFESVVLHELGHGLGFTGSADFCANGNGVFGNPGNCTAYPAPFIFDQFNGNAAGTKLVTLTNPSAALGAAFTSKQVYWTGAAGKAANGGNKPQLYAPEPWEDGSSIAHLDETAYPVGNANSLMTPYVQEQEVVHSPGTITVGMLKDTGWDAVLAAPAAPTGVTADPLESAVHVTWAAPAPNGSPITGYTILVTTGTTTTQVASPGTGTSTTVSGLADGTSYTFSVKATNAIGTGVASTATAPVTPAPDTTKPTVSVTSGPGPVSGSSVSISFAGADANHPTPTLTYRCTFDGTAAACTSPFTRTGLSNGPHSFSVIARDASANDSAATPTRSWTADTVAPAISTTATPLFTMTTNVGLQYAGTDSGSGIASYNVRWRAAPFNGGFGAFVYPGGWQGATVTTVGLRVGKGTTYCLSAQSRDKGGNLSPWSAERCTSTVLDDRSLAASTGWKRGAYSRMYAGTYTYAARTGVSLTRTGVQARQLALVVTSCRGCGNVGIYWNGRLTKTLSLNATGTTYRRLITIGAFSRTYTGTVTIKTLNAGRVYIDGLAMSRV